MSSHISSICCCLYSAMRVTTVDCWLAPELKHRGQCCGSKFADFCTQLNGPITTSPNNGTTSCSCQNHQSHICILVINIPSNTVYWKTVIINTVTKNIQTHHSNQHFPDEAGLTSCSLTFLPSFIPNRYVQVAQLSQRDRTARWVRYGQKWNCNRETTFYEYHRFILNHCDIIGQQSNQIR